MDKKSILIGALGASLLFVTFGATYPEQEPKGVWELHFNNETDSRCYLLNTETGEVRIHARVGFNDRVFGLYKTSKPAR